MAIQVLLTIVAALAVPVSVCTCSGQTPSRERLCLVDDAAKDPTFLAFRTELLRIVRAKDGNALNRALADDIQLSVSGATGIDTFNKLYLLRNPTTTVWVDLERILSLGGVFKGADTFCAPYTRCPGPSEVSTDVVVILGNHVPALAKPSVDGAVVEWLSCDVLRVSGDQLPPPPPVPAIGWEVVFLGSRWAFVQESYTRSPSDLYVNFSKRNGRWLLTVFMAGD